MNQDYLGRSGMIAVIRRNTRFVLAAVLVCCAATRAQQSAPAEIPSAKSSTRGGELFTKLVEHNEQRTQALQEYTGTRLYELRNDKDEISAREVVRMEFRAPDTKTFQTVSAEGSVWIRKFVFKGLMKSEVGAAAGREHRDSSITPHNYTFRYLGEQQLDGRRSYFVYAIPNRLDKYLFEGLIWIDAEDFAVAKIVGHPAKNPSFWIKRVDWTRQYGKFGDFWLPTKDTTLTDIRIFGKKKLVIEYRNYVLNPPASGVKQAETTSPAGGLATGRAIGP